MRHILARLTHWVDSQCGAPSHFEDLISEGRARPFEIEHIWANQYERFTEWFPHPADFETERNRLGGLVLLQRGINQSLGKATYEEKRDAYAAHGANLLARSLHPTAYQNHPAFAAFIERTGLPFRPYDSFGPEQQQERQELYIRLAEWVWNPARLDLDGEKPPVPESIGPHPGKPDETDVELAERHLARLAFWGRLLEVANGRSDLHARMSPSKGNWICAHRDGVAWCYTVLEDQTGAAAYFDSPDATRNKALFDGLHAQQQAAETAFGGELKWMRMDDKKGCWVGVDFSGGWRDESTWPRAIEQAVDAMGRLHAALEPLIRDLRERS